MRQQPERTHTDGTFRCPSCGQTWQHIGGRCGQCGETVTLARVLAAQKAEQDGVTT